MTTTHTYTNYTCDCDTHGGGDRGNPAADRVIPKGHERFQVRGFEAARDGGGTNHVELRERTGVVWCASCVDLAKLKRDHGGVPGTLDL